MIKQGLLDKYGKPNDKTPGDYLAGSVAQLSVTTPVKKIKSEPVDDYVVPSEGPESSKRKVCRNKYHNYFKYSNPEL